MTDIPNSDRRAAIEYLVDRSIHTLPEFITLRETARFLGISKRSVQRRRAAGQLVGIQHQPGSTSPIFILKASLRDYLLKNAT